MHVNTQANSIFMKLQWQNYLLFLKLYSWNVENNKTTKHIQSTWNLACVVNVDRIINPTVDLMKYELYKKDTVGLKNHQILHHWYMNRYTQKRSVNFVSNQHYKGLNGYQLMPDTVIA